MSSFNINGPSSQPLVQSSQNLGKDGGGGGNTGFMNMRNKKKKGEDKKEEDNSVFLEEEIEDTFEKQGEPKKTKSGKIMGAIKGFIKDKKNKENKNIRDDAFVKKEADDEEESDDNYSAYNVPLKKVDPIEDDEYEVVDDDDYYNGIDV